MTTRTKQSDASKPTHIAPVHGNAAPRVLATNHAEDLRRSGLTAETIELAGLYSESKSKPIADLLGWRWTNGGGLVFPFRDYDSRKLVLSRVKPDKPRRAGAKKKPVKYEQPPGSTSIPFVGPYTIREQRFGNSACDVYWTEGEKKGLLLDQLGCAVLALTGCHNFNDSQKLKDGDGLAWGRALAKYAERFVRGRNHVIVYDSDAFANEQVMLAMQRLAGLLLAGGAASVRYVQIPADPNDADRGVGIDDFYVEFGEEATRALLANTKPIASGEEVAPIPPKDPLLKLASVRWLRGAKLPTDLRLPPRYEVRRDRSLWVEPADRPEEVREVMRNVVFPVAVFESWTNVPGGRTDGAQKVEIVYRVGDHWRRAVVDRRDLRDSRRAVAELPADAPISTNNAREAIAFFDDFFKHNEHRLETRRVVDKCGWHEGEEEAFFMLGEPVARDGSKLRLEPDASDARADVFRALRPRGSNAAHVEALCRAFDEDPRCAVAILAALATPLLKPLGAPNFGVHLWGDSSRGKSSMLACAASVYGDPTSRLWIGSWNATKSAVEVRAAVLNDLPLCFDEVGAGEGREAIAKSIYTLIDGTGKARSNRSVGIQATADWRTIVVSTGEFELADERTSTGAQVRLIQARVTGFGSFDGRDVDEVREACRANAGSVGRKWIETLLRIEDWGPYLSLFAEAKAQFRREDRNTGGVNQRQAVYFATLAVAEHVASQALGIGRKGGATVRELFTDVANRRQVRTATERGIDALNEWVASEPASFPWLRHDSSAKLVAATPQGGRKVFGVRNAVFVAFLPDALREKLHSVGVSPDEVVAGLNDRNALDSDSGRSTKKLRWNGARQRVVAVKNEVLGLDGEGPGDDFAE